jgi:hypothetical protein
MFVGMGLVLNQGKGISRDNHSLSDDIAEWNGPYTDYPVEKVPERFGPLNDCQGFGNLGSLWEVFLLLILQRFHNISKFFDMRPLKVCGGVVSTSRKKIAPSVLSLLMLLRPISSRSWT